MDSTLLVTGKIEAGANLIAKLLEHQFDLEGAGWVKPDTESRWKLYLVLPIDSSNPTGVFETIMSIHRLLKEESIDIDPQEISVIDGNQTYVVGLMEAGKRLHNKTGMWHSGPRLGRVFVEDAYVYSIPVAQPA